MDSRIVAPSALLLSALFALPTDARAQSILLLNGSGTTSIEPSLIAAGFNVIPGTLDPGQIAANFAVHSDIVEVWIWSDYTYGNGGVPADPLRDFNAADLSALAAFSATHPHWIFDGLAWRGDSTPAEVQLTKNEALTLAAAGGGIVLGADDASGGSVVQHPNQVCAYFGFAPWEGVFITYTADLRLAGTALDAPAPFDPNLVYATNTYCMVPHGLQPNGLVLGPVLYGTPSTEHPGFPSPPLATEVLGGVLRTDVDFLITTTLPGGAPPEFTSFCAGDGSGTACPCGNDGAPGRGCDSSLGNGGALLTAIGAPSLAADDFTLQASGMPATATALYFQGSAAANGTQGLVLGDGVICVGGTAIRLGARGNTAGASGYGAQLGDLAVSIRGAIPPAGGTYYYQAWYRNAAPYCTPATFNMTNALAATWRP